ncbi:cell division cycle 20.2, cofactor of APC complex-like [Melia azedarach]|uniref:Cell division cycle 20.2, cofactor of APC complex-like n=1 Tax=Melia azedarach TaxID=155640 RepID=A0ACC1X1Y3_MELAZ|nr:cell division cycle 20.2, cofactor of APC complex-like [Melia azedarach]
MSFGYAHYMLTEGRKDKENGVVACSSSRKRYRQKLAEALDMNRTRILAFRNKPPTFVDPIPSDWGSSNVLAILSSNTVYLGDASNSSTSELVTFDDEDGPVTNVSRAPDGQHISILACSVPTFTYGILLQIDRLPVFPIGY